MFFVWGKTLLFFTAQCSKRNSILILFPRLIGSPVVPPFTEEGSHISLTGSRSKRRKGRNGESNARISGFDGSVHLCVPFFAGGMQKCNSLRSEGEPRRPQFRPRLDFKCRQGGPTFLVRLLLRWVDFFPSFWRPVKVNIPAREKKSGRHGKTNSHCFLYQYVHIHVCTTALLARTSLAVSNLIMLASAAVYRIAWAEAAFKKTWPIYQVRSEGNEEEETGFVPPPFLRRSNWGISRAICFVHGKAMCLAFIPAKK